MTLDYHRELTERERLHDIAGIEQDFDDAEALVKIGAKPEFTRILEVLAKDPSAPISPRLLVDALMQGMDVAVTMGREQVRRSFQVKLEQEPFLDRLLAQAEAGAQAAIDALKTAARNLMLAARGELTDEMEARLEERSDAIITSTSVSLARAAYKAGRQSEAHGNADTLIYSGILDDNECDDCLSHEGEVYSDTDPSAVGSLEEGEALMGGNPNCEGVMFGNACRSIMLVEGSS